MPARLARSTPSSAVRLAPSTSPDKYATVLSCNMAAMSCCSLEIVRAMSREGIKINMTAIFTPTQVAQAVEALAGGAPACVSVFAGRLADFGIDYRPIMNDAIARARKTPNVEIIWASTREVFNVVEADNMGCHIITAPADVLLKLPALGSLSDAQLSLGAVKAFRDDALAAGLTLDLPGKAHAAE